MAQSSLLAWLKQRQGVYLTAPGGLGGQCVDLCNLYLLWRGLRAVRADARDWPEAARQPGLTWVPNGPQNAPPAGAVVCWRGAVPAVGLSPFGHVAISVAADPFVLLTSDQDWPNGSPASMVYHNYAGVVGWFVVGRGVAASVMVK